MFELNPSLFNLSGIKGAPLTCFPKPIYLYYIVNDIIINIIIKTIIYIFWGLYIFFKNLFIFFLVLKKHFFLYEQIDKHQMIITRPFLHKLSTTLATHLRVDDETGWWRILIKTSNYDVSDRQTTYHFPLIVITSSSKKKYTPPLYLKG